MGLVLTNIRDKFSVYVLRCCNSDVSVEICLGLEMKGMLGLAVEVR